MPIAKTLQNTSILEYALHHLEKEAAEIQGKIDHIHRQLGQKVASVVAAVAAAPAAVAAPRKKRVLSAAARKRIAAAQRKRWAEHRKTTGGKAA
jgi:hypothetical protein